MARKIHRLLIINAIILILESILVLCNDNITISEELFLEESEKRGIDLGWSDWSDWSPCSRTCDGGATFQVRQCNAPSGCRGEGIRYKICAMQVCPEPHEFRAQQCQAFRDLPYQGTYYDWEPHYDDVEPCALTCKARGDNLVVQLAPKVQDGTRCRPGSLDMCIGGKCQRVGCDLRIGSAKKVDECGVCGGDGSSCLRPLYHWEETPMSLCSVTCGGGYKMSRPICKNRISGEEVADEFCNMANRPIPRIVECNSHRCPAKWTTEAWGPCSVTCGGGVRFRTVFCGEDRNSTKVKVFDHLCHGHKPRYQEPCNVIECPRWYSGAWSGCSTSCGEGMQTRNVWCKDARGHPSPLCDDAKIPMSTQLCKTGIECPRRITDDNTSDFDMEELPGIEHTQPLIQPYPPAPSFSKTSGLGVVQNLVEEQVVPAEPSYIADDWGACSVSCGEGTKRRTVHCKIFLEFSRTIATLPDKECPGPKPSETEPCFMKPCSLSNSRIETIQDGYESSAYHQDATRHSYKDTLTIASGMEHSKPGVRFTYMWKSNSYTPCSASCLGGVQELMVQCIREQDQKVVSPLLCPRDKQPDVITKTCNDHPCPPRWNVSDFAPCSKTCGGGIQARDVHCIHEVTRGGGNTLVVPSNMCPQPPPRAQKFCNVHDCPPHWEVGDYGKCSKSCGGGFKKRDIHCRQVLALGQIKEIPPAQCPDLKPAETRDCNQRTCKEDEAPKIATSNHTYVQQAPKEKLTLKIGGKAVVFQGTTVKIKCPVKRFNRSKIQWARDHEYIRKTGRKYGISKKGALRIAEVAFSDSGIYSCIAGQSSANLTLTVTPVPRHFLASEEFDRNRAGQYGPGSLETKEDPNSGDATYRGLGTQEGRIGKPLHNHDDYSHEFKSSGKNWNTEDNEDENKEKERKGKGRKKGRNKNRQGQFSDDVVTRPGDTWDGHSTLVADQKQNLWPLQGGKKSGGRELETIFDSPSVVLMGSPLNDGIPFDSDEQQKITVDVLGKGNTKDLKFDWLITDWSRCSQDCGSGGGFQVRAAQCIVRLHNITRTVEHNLCEDAGLSRLPETLRTCGLDSCPQWVPSDWTPCQHSRCYAWNTAIQRRQMACQLLNGTEVNSTWCNYKLKPRQKRECYSEHCKGTWVVGEWSECTAPCGEQGIHGRILQCVWFGTKKPAGNACHDMSRPAVIKLCKGPPCPKNADCKDKTKHCAVVRTLNMCRVPLYQRQCCRSCYFRKG